jgi:pentose-5-phosphate-3-epimerase
LTTPDSIETDGCFSKDSKTTEAELSKLRESEDTNSMAHLGVKAENNVYLRISDGDIQDNLENIGKIAEAGADIFVAGAAIYSSKDYGKTIREMQSKIKRS